MKGRKIRDLSPSSGKMKSLNKMKKRIALCLNLIGTDVTYAHINAVDIGRINYFIK